MNSLNPNLPLNLNQVGRARRARRIFLPRGISTAYSTGVAVLALCAMLHAPYANAAGICSQHSLSSGSVSVTNTQKRTAWHPVAILFRFDAPVTATLTVIRQTDGTTFQLTTVELSGNQYAVWVPEAPITFNLGDVLIVTSTETSGTVEIIRKGE